MQPSDVRRFVEAKATVYRHRQASDKQRGLVAGMIEACFDDDEAAKRHSVLKYLTGYESLKDVLDEDVCALLDWLKPFKDEEGDWCPADSAVAEAQAILRAHYEAMGQMRLIEET